MQKEKTRNSNIEILRIISMIFIVLSHYSSHNGIMNYNLPIGINRFLLNIFVLGNIGVILFVLISGCFLIDSDKFSLRKLLKIVLQVWFYSIIIYIVCCICGFTKFSIRGLIVNFLPITSKRYWFVTSYIVLYIFHPFINKFLKTLSKQGWLLFLGVCFILFSIIPTFLTSTANFYGNELIQFLIFYAIGGYLKKYGFDWLTKKRNIWMLIVTTLTLLLSVVAIDLLSIKIPMIGKYATYLYDRHSIVAILFSISLFVCFINKKPFHNRFINTISAATFGVYLIHDNNYIRYFLWNNIIHSGEYVSSHFLFFHALGSVALVFSICVLIDFLREIIIEKPVFKKLGLTIDTIQDKIVEKFKIKI